MQWKDTTVRHVCNRMQVIKSTLFILTVNRYNINCNLIITIDIKRSNAVNITTAIIVVTSSSISSSSSLSSSLSSSANALYLLHWYQQRNNINTRNNKYILTRTTQSLTYKCTAIMVSLIVLLVSFGPSG